MFSEITVLSMLAIIIAKQVKDTRIKTVSLKSRRASSCPPNPPGSYGPAFAHTKAQLHSTSDDIDVINSTSTKINVIISCCSCIYNYSALHGGGALAFFFKRVGV